MLKPPYAPLTPHSTAAATATSAAAAAAPASSRGPPAHVLHASNHAVLNPRTAEVAEDRDVAAAQVTQLQSLGKTVQQGLNY